MPAAKPANARRLRTIVRFWVLLAALAGIVTGLLELGTRLLFPKINHQGTELALFRDHAFGDTVGWQPNAVGSAFGEPVVIDEFGFRKLASPVDYQASWLILGDSVTFGVGVNPSDTFVGRLQNQLIDTKLWNTAVVGYSAKDYEAVLGQFKDPKNKLSRVILFLCLNDIYPIPNLQPKTSGPSDHVVAWLGRNSKLYLLLKNTFFDRSRRYFEADLAFYQDHRPEYVEFQKTLATINQTARANNVPLTVVLLPYEYQLRVKTDDALRPQRMLHDFFTKNNIPFLDAYPWLAASGVDSKDLYLYADAMHFSRSGHQQIYEHLVKELTPAR